MDKHISNKQSFIYLFNFLHNPEKSLKLKVFFLTFQKPDFFVII